MMCSPKLPPGQSDQHPQGRNGLVLDGDLRYNIELMKKNNVKKGCLYRSASHYLCRCGKRC